MPIEAFSLECEVSQLPPNLAEVQAKISERLSPGQVVLQWAIVKSDPRQNRLWIEGCAKTPEA